MAIDPRIIDQKLIDMQRGYISHKRIQEMVASRDGGDRYTKAKRAYDTAVEQLDEMLAARPDLDLNPATGD